MKQCLHNLSASRTPVILVLVILCMTIVLEIRHPFFFFQDDNRNAYLPFFVHNLRAVAGGEIPLFNFHQALGTPTTILYASFYPLYYGALLLSRLLTGDYYWTMEIIALAHLLIAGLGFYCLMRSFKLEQASCFFGAVAWTFCGFVITAGNSWIHVLGTAAYLPIILLFSLRQIDGFNLRDFMVLVGLRVACFSLGNPQSFVYLATFDCMVVYSLYLAKRSARGSERAGGWETLADGLPLPPSHLRFLVTYFGNYVVVALLAMPLILQAFHQTTISAERKSVLSWGEYAAYSYDMLYWLNGLVAPFRNMAVTVWNEQQFIPHIGYLPLVFIAVALWNMGKAKQRTLIIVFSAVALFSLLWASDTLVTKLFYYLPVYNRMRFPFKVGFFTSFFLIMVSTLGFNLFYTQIQQRVRAGFTTIIFVVLCLHVANFMALYLLFPQRAFSRLLDKVPLSEPLKNVMTDGRIVTAWLDPVFDNDKIVPDYAVPTVGYNYASLWGLSFIGGYDSLIPEKNVIASLERVRRGDFNVEPGHVLDIEKEVPLDHFRKWGVRWYVIEKSIPLVNTSGLVATLHADDFRKILYDPVANSLVYWADDGKGRGIDAAFTSRTIAVKTARDHDGTLVVGVVYNPFFSAVVDGTSTPVHETPDGQMALNIPAGPHTVLLSYSDRYFNTGLYIAASSLVLLLLWGGAAVWSRKR